MKHWWVPGLQIGYEHTFIHQVADFLLALTEASPRPYLPRRARYGICYRCGPEVCKI